MSERIERLQAELQDSDLDGLVLNPGATLFYLTGQDFDSHERLFLLLIPKDGEPVAVVPAFERGKWLEAVPSVDRIFLWEDADGPEKAAAGAFRSLANAERLGVEPLDFRFFEVECVSRHVPGAKLASAEKLVLSLRASKDDEEAANIRQAAEIASAALSSVLAGVDIGSTESGIAAQLASELLRRGGGGISFGPIVLGGPNSALPHGVPGERALESGDLLLIDFGTSFKGYHCDITRTFVVGEPDERTREVYEAVRAANQRGREATRAGATAHEVHTQCQQDLDDPKWQDFMKHRTGHGLGLEVHEPPSVMRGNDETLDVGTVFTIEPGLYLEGWGGVRIEDDVRVTQDGCEVLTSYPRELLQIGRTR